MKTHKNAKQKNSVLKFQITKNDMIYGKQKNNFLKSQITKSDVIYAKQKNSFLKSQITKSDLKPHNKGFYLKCKKTLTCSHWN